MGYARTRQDGKEVLFEASSKNLQLTWQAAKDIARALMAASKAAEEYENAQSGTLIRDQAILTRLGARFGLTSNPAIQKEAMNAALYDRDLRRFLPGGIKSQEHVGVPAVIRHKARRPNNVSR